MHKIQRQLHVDHHHLQRLLNCLTTEIDCYDFDSKRAADLAVILSALDYVDTYPDKWHHPSEDIIFDRLLEKDVKESKLIEQLKQEHKEIILETGKIHQLFDMVANDCIVPADELLGGARHFITLQRKHLEKENEFVYPLMDVLFDAEEWKAIESEIKIQDDPLFKKQSKKEFEHLYQYILDLENEH
ncbi:MAG: hemerythrin domain-containing protein [Nitrosomonas sp.]|nr:hemerythrin domain-containing protein [Nitrosomonas sp.]